MLINTVLITILVITFKILIQKDPASWTISLRFRSKCLFVVTKK